MTTACSPRFAPRLTLLEDRLAPVADLISINAAGTQAGDSRSQLLVGEFDSSRDPSRAISADGRYVLFQSFSKDLGTPPPAGGSALFVRDRMAGTTSVASVLPNGTVIGAGDPSISADGSTVVFPASDNKLYSRNLLAGTTILITSGGLGNGVNVSVSDDGRYTAFRSSNPLVTEDKNGINDMYIHDRMSGTVTLASHTLAGGAGNGAVLDGVISGNGKTVVFRSAATDLTATPDTNGANDLFAYSVADGTVSVVSPNLVGTATANMGTGFNYRVDGTGTKVVFLSPSTDLTAVSGVTLPQAFVRDLASGTTRLLSVRPDGTPGNADVKQPAISSDGQFVTFVSSSVLSPDPSPNTPQVYLVEVATGRLTLASRTPGGTGAGGLTEAPTLSGDGRYVAFLSNAQDLVPGVTLGAAPSGNKQTRFVYDRLTNQTFAISTTAAGDQTIATSSQDNTRFAISRDGRTVVFTSFQAGFGPADTNNELDVYASTVPLLSPNAPPTITDVVNQSTIVGVAIGPIGFTVADAETAAGALSVTAKSSNTTLVPTNNVTFGGSGGNRTVTVTPAAGQTGTATITLTVTDGNGATASDAFTVTVNEPPPLLVGFPQFLAGSDAGGASVTLFDADGSKLASLQPFPGFTGGVRTAAADFNADGVADIIAGTGPGRATR
ncbi:MAG: PD40 domain-containing protein, partial [Gemmataceae bacterium]|nr:PD40 domain-containing protein [Gemmataceae bacterium]